MTRKILATNRPVKKQDESELRRWCIKQASRWPLVQIPATYSPNAGPAGMQQPNWGTTTSPARDVDADLIGRATKILNWVKGE